MLVHTKLRAPCVEGLIGAVAEDLTVREMRRGARKRVAETTMRYTPDDFSTSGM